MSDSDNNDAPTPARNLPLSPDPKIKIKTTGTNPPAYTFTRESTTWHVSPAINGSNIYTSGQVVLMSPAAGESTVSVTVTDNSGQNFDSAVMYQTQALVRSTTTFSVDATVDDEEYDFRLKKALSPNPVSQFYYVRTLTTDASGKHLFANFQSGDNYVWGREYDSSKDAAYQWAFLPNVLNGTSYLIMFTRDRGAFAQIGAANAIQAGASYYHFAWHATDGVLQHIDQNQYWTAHNTGSNVSTGILKALAKNSGFSYQKWQLVPAELGPNWTGAGILGPTS